VKYPALISDPAICNAIFDQFRQMGQADPLAELLEGLFVFWLLLLLFHLGYTLNNALIPIIIIIGLQFFMKTIIAQLLFIGFIVLCVCGYTLFKESAKDKDSDKGKKSAL